ncbi:FtsL-like putative cell division protein [Flammeovirga pacifica]|uniref:S-adenosyl-methyltransferase n=1 Tax=Flammeovirga pacifica TaxID=915059 RepID=A0A1S1YYL9_FLAPC|nr:FtsL-like putative cell division protein [Flammeovirga pacifica]OHX66090.1 hypothetical protein NH26_06870 [Flammeovirga pacifica]
MKANTYKTVVEEAPKKKRPSVLDKWNKKFLRWKFISQDEEEENSQYIQKIVFVTFLGILYIANSFQAEKSHLRINRLEKSVEKMRVEYSTLKYDFINESKRSQIENKAKNLGLVPLENAPVVISIPKLEDQ